MTRSAVAGWCRRRLDDSPDHLGTIIDDAPCPQPTGGDHDGPCTTVEAEVRARIAETLGGPRGAVETALPFIVFTVAYVTTADLRLALGLGVGAALVLLVVRLAQRSSARFVGNGLLGIAIAAVVSTATGRAESAFLPGIIQNAATTVAMAVSVLVGWPAAGFVIGAAIGQPTTWRANAEIVRLGNRLTIVLLVPMVVRVAVQYPLYLAGEVGWLGVTRVALGWPAYLAALLVAGAILARGHTHLDAPPGDEPGGGARASEGVG